jgi:hypothetical protein
MAGPDLKFAWEARYSENVVDEAADGNTSSDSSLSKASKRVWLWGWEQSVFEIGLSALWINALKTTLLPSPQYQPCSEHERMRITDGP